MPPHSAPAATHTDRMDKNTITGFILMAVVLIGFTWYSQPSAEQIAAQREADSIAAVAMQQDQQRQRQLAKEQAAAAQQARAATLADSTSLLFAAHQGSEQLITIANDLIALTINTHGGTIEDAVLKGYNDQQHQPIHLLSKADAAMVLSLPTKTDNIITSDLFFQPVAADSSSVTMRLPLGTGSIDIAYRLRPGSYMVDMVVSANGVANYFTPSEQTLAIDWSDRARQLEKGFDFEQRYSCIRYHEADGGTDYLSETADDDEECDEPLDWVAFKNQFFSAVLISHQHFTKAHLTSRPFQKGQGYLKDYHAALATTFDPTGAQPTQLQMYIGPNDFHTLKAHNDLSLDAGRDLELEDLVYLGWPIVRWINRWFIIYLFDWLKGLGLHMGLVLLLLTIIVKALVYPATKKSYIASARMRVLKPKVDELNAKYPRQEDAMRKQQEMMQLYSQYGVSPMGGCLPMLIQMPIWVALFNFVPNAIELRGQSFLWADDLSAYDDVIRWGSDLWLIGDHLSIFCLLFCAMQVANTWVSMKQQQSAAMTPEQEQSMKMMRWMMYLMPIMFFFMFNTYSSGLNYYYFLSGLTSILIMWFLRRTTDDSKLLAQLEAYRAAHANDPKKTSGMAARLEALQRMAAEQQRQQKK